MTDTPYPSLAEFAESFGKERTASERVPWAHTQGNAAFPSIPDLGIQERVEDLLDTVVALERATWLQEGVYIGPRAVPDLHRLVLAAARTVRISVPPAILGALPLSHQGVYGTNARAFLAFSTYYIEPASEVERRFFTGRLCGHIAARQVSRLTLYALLVDQNGMRKMAGATLGAALDVFMMPLSIGVRLALSRWHRVAEVDADRAGLLCCRDLNGAGMALLRESLGVKPGLTPEEYLRQNRAGRAPDSPGRWAEMLSAKPWMHKRMRALELFARSELYAELGGEPLPGERFSHEDLARHTTALLQVS